jgi:S1-C subfamily serine protease
MKTIISIFCLLSSVILSQQQITIHPEQLYKNTLPSIMTLQVLRSDGTQVIGSAFLAIDDGIAITAYHVIKDAIQVKAKFSDAEVFDVSGIIDKDETRDIALIRVKVFGKQQLQLIRTEPEIGSQAFIIGAPLGLEFSISDGLLSQVQIFDGIKNYQFTCPASPGNSGCPLINKNGEVMGVVCSGVREGQNLNFATPSHYVLGLDKSLPTTPFNITSGQLSTKSDIFSKSHYIRFLATSLNDYHDLQSMLDFIRHIQTFDANQAYKHFEIFEYVYTISLPSEYFTLVRQVSTQLEEFKRLIVKDESLFEINSIYIKKLEDILKSSEIFEEAINKARRLNGWTSSSNELLSKSYSYYSPQIEQHLFNSNLDKFLIDSTDFLLLVNDEIKAMLNVIYDYPRFRLGIFYITREPDYIYLVDENTLAEGLGLESRDRVMSYGSTKFDGFINFKKYIYENRGKTINIKVKRDDEIEELTPNVPADISSYELK